MPFQGFTLDFHTPWINGMAKKMILLGLRALINPVTRNWVINHYGKVFELKAIAPIIAGVDLVFLINDLVDNWLLWKIVGVNGLIPYETDPGLSRLITLISGNSYPSTTKSDDRTYKNSHLRIENASIQGGGIPYYGKVAAVVNQAPGTVLIGNVGCYEPSDYNFNGARVYTSNSAGDVCGARHSFQRTTGGLIVKNLRVSDEEGTGDPQIQYETNGVTIKGQVFTDYDIYAALSPTKVLAELPTIEVDAIDEWEIYSYAADRNTPPYIRLNNNCPIDVFDMWRQIEKATGTYNMVKFGGVNIAKSKKSGYSRGWSTTPRVIDLYYCDAADTNTVMYRYDSMSNVLSSNEKIRVMDYDHIADGSYDVDDCFALLWYSEWRGYDSWRDVLGVPVTHPNPSFDIVEWIVSSDGRVRDFNFTYKLPGSGIVATKVTTLNYGEYRRRTNVIDISKPWGRGYPDWFITHIYGPIPPCVDDTETRTSGNRMRRPSIKISDGRIFYTYVIEPYIGPTGVNNMDDFTDSNWGEPERTIGVIDIATGSKRKYTTTLDGIGLADKNSAIGLLKG